MTHVDKEKPCHRGILRSMANPSARNGREHPIMLLPAASIIGSHFTMYFKSDV
jgi:hypothetical protein